MRKSTLSVLLLIFELISAGNCQETLPAECPALTVNECVQVTCQNLSRNETIECVNKDVLVPQGTFATYRCKYPREGKDDGNQTFTIMCICHGKWWGIERFLKYSEWCGAINTGPFVEGSDAAMRSSDIQVGVPEEIKASIQETTPSSSEITTAKFLESTHISPLLNNSESTGLASNPTSPTQSETTHISPLLNTSESTGSASNPTSPTEFEVTTVASGQHGTEFTGTTAPSSGQNTTESTTPASAVLSTTVSASLEVTTGPPAQSPQNATTPEWSETLQLGNGTRSGTPESRSLFNGVSNTSAPPIESAGATTIAPAGGNETNSSPTEAPSVVAPTATNSANNESTTNPAVSVTTVANNELTTTAPPASVAVSNESTTNAPGSGSSSTVANTNQTTTSAPGSGSTIANNEHTTILPSVSVSTVQPAQPVSTPQPGGLTTMAPSGTGASTVPPVAETTLTPPVPVESATGGTSPPPAAEPTTPTPASNTNSPVTIAPEIVTTTVSSITITTTMAPSSIHAEAPAPENLTENDHPANTSSSTSSESNTLTTTTTTPSTTANTTSEATNPHGVEVAPSNLEAGPVESSSNGTGSGSGVAPPNLEAVPTNFTDYELVALDLHNKYRQNHNVSELKLNQTLNEIAQSWAEHELNEKTLKVTPGTRSYAENMYKVSGWKTLTSVRAVQEALKTWYSSLEKYNWAEPNPTGFSQIVWKKTTDIGVGVAKQDDVTVVAVTYWPRGNIILIGANNQTDPGKLFRDNVFPKVSE